MTNQQNSLTSFVQGAVVASIVWSCGCYCYYIYGYKDSKVSRDGRRMSRGKSDFQFDRNESDLSHKQNASSNENNEKVVETISRIVSNRTMVVSETVRKRMRWPWETLRLKLSNPKIHGKEKTSGDHMNTSNIDRGTNETKKIIDGIEPSKNLNENKVALDSSFPTLLDGDELEQNNEKKSVCIGSIFGLDAGGTLSKLVYFEEQSSTDNQYNSEVHHSKSNERFSMNKSFRMNSRHPLKFRDIGNGKRDSIPASFQPATGTIDERMNQEQLQQHNSYNIIRSRSMFDFSAQRAEALDRFFNFIRKLDTYYEQKGNGNEPDSNRNKSSGNSTSTTKECNLSFYSRTVGGTFHFMNFETRHMHKAMELVYTHKLHLNIHKMGATGGGAHKYAKDWKRRLNIQMVKQDELDSLVVGMQFILLDVIGECYTFQPYQSDAYFSNNSSSEPQPQSSETDKCKNIPTQTKCDSKSSVGLNLTNHPLTMKDKSKINSSRPDAKTSAKKNVNPTMDENDNKEPKHENKSKSNLENKKKNNKNSTEKKFDIRSWARKVKRDVAGDNDAYPYMVVIIGTGVSLLRVDGPRKYERVSGSTIGGGTYWGLCRLLTDVETFEDVMKIAEQGNPSKVDMMVGDIYGNDSEALEKLGLPANIVASSFGKLVSKQEPAAGLKQEDLARALLFMVTNNIGQVAYLNAQLHQTKRIFFVGNFLRHNTISQQRLSYAINFWSRGKMEALFLEHEGYFGALGAFLLSQERQKQNSDEVKNVSLCEPDKSSRYVKPKRRSRSLSN